MELLIYLVYFAIGVWIFYIIIAAAVKAGVKGALSEFKNDIMKELIQYKVNENITIENEKEENV